MPPPLQLEASCHCGAIQLKYSAPFSRLMKSEDKDTDALYVVLLLDLSQNERKRRIRHKYRRRSV